jgi:ferredoxin
MHVEFDKEACTGHGRCYALSPGLEAAARRGAENCPEGAITISTVEG